MPRCDGKPRQPDAGDGRFLLRCPREALRIDGCEIDDKPDDRHRFVGQPLDADPAHLDESRERRWRKGEQTSVPGFELHPIVGDQAGEAEPP